MHIQAHEIGLVGTGIIRTISTTATRRAARHHHAELPEAIIGAGTDITIEKTMPLEGATIQVNLDDFSCLGMSFAHLI